MKPVVVFAHIHYVETWASLRARVEDTLQVPFRVIVTTTGATGDIPAPQSRWLRDFTVVQAPNRGRDVLPFLSALELAGDFDVGLKLHGKRSVHRLDGEAWRDALVSSLLPSPEDVSALVARMEGGSPVGLAGPANSLCSIERHVGGNESAMGDVAERLGFDLAAALERTPFFSAGTMFWFRREALDALARTDLTDLFADEAGQTDGTHAHALERLFAVLAEERGFVATSVDAVLAAPTPADVPALREATRERVDIDETFVRVPSRMAAFVMRRMRFAVPVYLALPKPVRRAIKATASGTLGLVRR